MKLKTVKGTQRHAFDIEYVQRLLEKKGSMDLEDATRILGESIHVIGGLRVELRAMYRGVDELKGQSDFSKENQWLKYDTRF